MPIKLPKGFARRKSSGNALEEVENPPQPSFRVFERPSVDRKSFSDGNLLSKRLSSDGHLLYTPTEEEDNIFAGSENPPTKNRGEIPLSSYESSTSVRFSSSTRRSSPDVPVQSDAQYPHSRSPYDIPAVPISSALRAAGRTFSFGGRLSKGSPSTPSPQQSISGPSRSRAVTSSTVSTAAPLKLLDTELNVGGIEDDFNENLFDNFGKRNSTIIPEPFLRDKASDTVSQSPPNHSPTASRKVESVSRPAPINTDRSQEVEPSQYSWDSRHSEEDLLATFNSPREYTSENPSTLPHTTPIFPGGQRKSLPMSATVSSATTSHRSLVRPQAGADKGGLRRSVVYASKRDSVPVEDDDARLIMESLYSKKGGSQLPSTSDHESSDVENDIPLAAINKRTTTERRDRLKPIPASGSESPALAESQFDPSIAANALLAAQYEESQPVSASSNKVMTPSQFERYRQQQELRRSNSDASKSDESVDSHFDEEDEAEKNREVERQRRKQEAHLSVYRQQMMKITGQQSPAPSLRPEMDQASSSTPNLTIHSSNPGNKSGSGKSEGDDDEEVPLGILAAHGFPNRQRPPSRLIPSSSIPNLRASFHQPYVSSPGSVAGDHDVSNRTSLPVFARNLPRDPYLGAGLVNPSNRESLALGGGASVYGGPSPSPALPPGGLVGVIATEERARAMRRGSPNTQAAYDYQNGMGMPGVPSQVPRPYTMMGMNSSNPQLALSASEQAQIQLSQQMSQMMQMQMQWMQQMIQVQGGQGGQGLPVLPPMGFPPPMIASTNMRPASMASAGPLNNHFAGFNDQRTLSMIDPNVSSQLNGPPMPYLSGGNGPSPPGGYASSIAPSERSNVGMAPRYRPVSTIQFDQGSTGYPPSMSRWNDENQKFGSPAGSHLPKAPAMPTVTVRPISTLATNSNKESAAVADDENDDEGWAEMKKKREKKKSSWKIKKETSSFGDLLKVLH